MAFHSQLKVGAYTGFIAVVDFASQQAQTVCLAAPFFQALGQIFADFYKALGLSAWPRSAEAARPEAPSL